jgi:hypothetical protein
MLKRIFGNYNNTILWFQEYKGTFKSTDLMKMTKLGFQFPVVLVKDFISLTKSQKITSSVLVLVIIGVLFGFDNKLQEINEENTLKCDCSMTRENDSSYGFWYVVGYDYGHDIPQLENVVESTNNRDKYPKSRFSVSWIKNWININGSKQKGGYPNMEKYRECWEKGFLVGRNDYYDDNDGSNRIPK